MIADFLKSVIDFMRKRLGYSLVIRDIDTKNTDVPWHFWINLFSYAEYDRDGNTVGISGVLLVFQVTESERDDFSYWNLRILERIEYIDRSRRW